MNCLIIETSTSTGSVGIFSLNNDEPVCLFEKTWTRKKLKPKDRGKSPSHSELAPVYIEQGLNSCKLTLNDIDFFMTSVGPGSFTGIRVGLNLVKTFCFSLNKPFLAPNSLMALALQAQDFGLPIVTMQNAFKNQVYLGKYEFVNGSLVETLSPKSVDIRTLPEFITHKSLCLGDGYGVYNDFLPETVKSILVRDERFSDSPRLQPLAQYAADHAKGLEINWKLLNPLYIRQSEAEEKLSLGLLKPLPKL